MTPFVLFPYRYDKNFDGLFLLVDFVLPVSIPHRYNINYTLEVIKMAKRKEFQFLIGTIQTFKTVVYAAFIIMFQFLIGTIQTHSKSVISTFSFSH